MQLWSFAKCSQTAEETDSKKSDAYKKICRARKLRIAALAACVVLLAALAALTVMHSETRQWEEIKTHEIKTFELTAEECVDYSIDMEDGEYVIGEMVMPSKSFTINSDGVKETYYVYLNNDGEEGIVRFVGDVAPEVKKWLEGWENVADTMPEPVEVMGRRGIMDISGTGEHKALADEYNGKSFIEADGYKIEREVPIEGAEEMLAQQETDKNDFEARRESLFTLMCVLFGVFIAGIAAFILGKHQYIKAVRAFMAENEAED